MNPVSEMCCFAGEAGDFDTFRKNYDSIDYNDLIEINARWDVRYPNQKHYSPQLIDWVLEHCNHTIVYELGCHHGELANDVLNKGNGEIIRWIGYDILRKLTSPHHKFVYMPLAKPFYKSVFPYHDDGDNIFVCSHTFEHMSGKEVIGCIEAIRGIKYMAFDIPISEQGQSWNGYCGSHILTRGRKWFRSLMEVEGYELVIETATNGSWQTFWREK